MKAIIFYLLGALLLLLYELAVAPLLPFGLDKMNLWLVVTVFISIAYEFYRGVTFALIGAFLFDLYSVLPFGAIMIAIAITLAVVYVVYRRFLTNKSLYATLVLTELATVVYAFVVFVYAGAVYFMETSDIALVYRLGLSTGGILLYQAVFHLLGVSILFLLFHASSRRFSAVFVDTIKT